MSRDDIDVNMSQHVRNIFEKAVQSVLPHIRLRQSLRFDGKRLRIENNHSYPIPKQGCHVVAFGKAVIGMAAELQRILQPGHIKTMVLSVPQGISETLAARHHDQLPYATPGLHVLEGAKDNIPDTHALKV